jgi:hypothetical protein
LRPHRLIREFDGVLRNVDAIIADTLEVGGDFQHGRNLAQLARNRLLPPDKLDAMRLDAPTKIVDGVVTGDDSGSRGGIAILERIDRDADRIAHQRSKPNDVESGSFQRLMIRCAHRHPHLP